MAALALMIQAFIGLTFFVSCIWEKEKRATLFAGVQLLGMLALVVAFFYLRGVGFFETTLGFAFLIAGLVFGALAAFLLMRKTAPNPKALAGAKGLIVGDVERHDERDQVFARHESLRPGSEQYQTFYQKHREWEEVDAKKREQGGPLGPYPGTIDRPYEGPNAAATMASWAIPIHLSTRDAFEPQPNPERREKKIALSPEEATERVKGYTRSLGADLVGITEINPLWIYSHRGEIYHENWEDWGKEINIEHKCAVVFAMEMSVEMVGTAPHSPTIIESMKNYARGAYIATQLASYIANLGYAATANHLLHYDAVLVPLAVDAGLGELGRLGYLITKKFGPRVRLGAVTTDLPLIPDKPVDIGVEDFCKICKKCALCCPSNSIQAARDQTAVNGLLRWKLNAETCYDYWGKVGTDCNICMRVCPWSHARTFPHKIILALNTRNRMARRLFSFLDDVFYGKRPCPKAAPKWAQINIGKMD
jgi:reductive dehalogenase